MGWAAGASPGCSQPLPEGPSGDDGNLEVIESHHTVQAAVIDVDVGEIARLGGRKSPIGAQVDALSLAIVRRFGNEVVIVEIDGPGLD